MKASRHLRPALLASSLALLAACGSATPSNAPAGDDPATPVPPADEPTAPPAPGPLGLTVSPDVVRIQRGESLDVTVEVDRKGREGAVTIAALELPPGVTAEDVTVPAGATTTTLRVIANQAAPLGGPRAFGVRGVVAGEETSAKGRLVVAGAPGTFDTTFGDNGLVLLRVTDREYDAARDVAVDGEGRTLVSGVGQGADPWLGFLVRFTIAGELDPTFGASGKVLGLPNVDHSDFSKFTFLPDASILVATHEKLGAADMTSGFRRFDPNGALDASFLGVERGPSAHLSRALVSSGSALFAGNEEHLASYDEHGVLVPSFGAAGKVDGPTRSLAVDASGRIVTCGYGADAFEVRRFLATGAPDLAFGDAGLARFPLALPEKESICARVLPHADGTITVVGRTQVSGINDTRARIVRFLEDGKVDASFGTGGALRWGGENTQASFIRADRDGDGIIVVGLAFGIESSWFVARYDAKGKLDPTFAQAGVRADIPVQRAFAMSIDRVSRRVVIGGSVDADPVLRVLRIWL